MFVFEGKCEVCSNWSEGLRYYNSLITLKCESCVNEEYLEDMDTEWSECNGAYEDKYDDHFTSEDENDQEVPF